MDANAVPLLFVGLFAIIAVGWFISGMSVHNAGRKEVKKSTSEVVAANEFWYGLSSTERVELEQISSLSDQEKWVKAHDHKNVLRSTSVLILIRELANRNYILYGLGSSTMNQFAVNHAAIPKPKQVSFKSKVTSVRNAKKRRTVLKRPRLPKSFR